VGLHIFPFFQYLEFLTICRIIAVAFITVIELIYLRELVFSAFFSSTLEGALLWALSLSLFFFFILCTPLNHLATGSDQICHLNSSCVNVRQNAQVKQVM